MKLKNCDRPRPFFMPPFHLSYQSFPYRLEQYSTKTSARKQEQTNSSVGLLDNHQEMATRLNCPMCFVSIFRMVMCLDVTPSLCRCTMVPQRHLPSVSRCFPAPVCYVDIPFAASHRAVPDLLLNGTAKMCSC